MATYTNIKVTKLPLPAFLFANGERTVLRNGFLTPQPLRYEEIYNDESFRGMRVGEVYVISESLSEDFNIEPNVYQCKHILKEYGGVNLNSVVMKQIEGDQSVIFSLTKADCRSIGIEYEPKLQLFPINMNWRPRRELREVPFSPLNMGTYKPSPKDGMIHQMHVSLYNVQQNNIERITTPTGKQIPLVTFLDTIRFKFKDKNLQKNYPITYKILTNKENTIIVKDNHIDFMLFFGTVGISPVDFDNKTIDDLIEVSWIESYKRRETPDEYKDVWQQIRRNQYEYFPPM